MCTQGYKAQADLVLAHLDGLLGGCEVWCDLVQTSDGCLALALNRAAFASERSVESSGLSPKAQTCIPCPVGLPWVGFNVLRCYAEI